MSEITVYNAFPHHVALVKGKLNGQPVEYIIAPQGQALVTTDAGEMSFTLLLKDDHYLCPQSGHGWLVEREHVMSDPHFKGFAELLWNELHTLAVHEGSTENYEALDKEIIARHADRLVEHAIKSINTAKMRSITHTVMVEQTVKDIPDLTEWPAQEPE